MRDEGTTGTSSVLFRSSSPLFFISLLFLVISFSVSKSDRTGAGGDRHAGRDGGSMDTCHVIFVLYAIYFFFSLFFFSVVYSTTTGRAGQDVTGPTWAAIEMRDEMGVGGSTATCHVTFCSLLYLFLLLALFFSIVYSTTTGRAGRGVPGQTQEAQQHEMGQGGRRARKGGRRAGCRSKEGVRQRRGTGTGRGLRLLGGIKSGEGALDERVAVADKEDERAGQGGG